MTRSLQTPSPIGVTCHDTISGRLTFDPPAPGRMAAGAGVGGGVDAKGSRGPSFGSPPDLALGEARGTIVAIAASLGLPPARLRAALPAVGRGLVHVSTTCRVVVRPGLHRLTGSREFQTSKLEARASSLKPRTSKA
jgi:hypothetical protein